MFPGVKSGVAAETVAVLLNVVKKADDGAVMVSVMGEAGPTARLGNEHVTTFATLPHVQPPPVALTIEAPAGRVSDTVTVDAVSGPLLVTVMV